MKKIFLTVLLAMLTVLSVFGLSSCDDECAHEWGEWSLSSPSTCSAQGTKQRKCSLCEEIQTDNIDIADHKYDTENLVWTWNGYESVTATLSCITDSTHTRQINANVTDEVTTAPTCTATGTKTCTATVKIDGITYTATKNETLAALGHTEVVDAAVAATCEKTGLTEGSHCSVCDEVLVAQQETPKAAHTETKIEAVAATCSAEGATEGKKCSVCDEILVAPQPTSKVAHTEETIPAVAATCEKAGLTEGKKCSVCDEVLLAQTESALAEHTEEIVPAVAATCSENGLTEGKKCSVCDEVLVAQQPTNKLPHTETALLGVAPSCTEEGLTEGKKCSVCETVTVPQEPIDKLPHTEETVVGTAPTCSATGLSDGKKCSVCKETLVAQTILHKVACNYESVVTAPTCEEQGYTTHTCSMCKDSFVDAYVDEVGHNWGVDVSGWTWKDYESATVCLVCANDKTHRTEKSADALVEIVPPTIEEEGYTLHTVTVELDGKTYVNSKKTNYISLREIWNNAIAEAINISNGTVFESYFDYTADGVEEYSFAQTIMLADDCLRFEFYSDNDYIEYYTYENSNLIIYEYSQGTWSKRICDDPGYAARALAKGFGKEGLLLVVKNLYSELEYDPQTKTFSIAETVILEEKYINCSIKFEGNSISELRATRVYPDGSTRKITMQYFDIEETSVTLPHIHNWNEGETTKEPSEEEDGIITYSCSGCTETYTEVIPSAGKNNWNAAFENAENMTNVTVIGGATVTYGDESSVAESNWYLDGYKMHIYSKGIDANNAENYYELRGYYEQIDGVNYCYHEDNGEWLKEIYEWDLDYSVEYICSTEFLTQLKNSFDKFNYDKATHTYSAPDFEIVLSSTYSNISLVIINGVITQFTYTMADEDMVGTVTMTFQNYGTTTVTLPHIHDWDNGTITTEPTETESGIKTYSCSGCSETKTEIVYAQSQSSWDSAFEKAETTTNVKVNINAVIEDGDETIEAYAVYLLDNYKLYMFSRMPASSGGYYAYEYYFAKIDGINYEFEKEYSNGAWVWVKTEYPYDDTPYVLSGLVLPFTFWTELKNSYAEFEYDINTHTYSSATKTMELYGITISNISVVIENGTLVGCNYTMTYEDGQVQKEEVTYTDYGTTIVEIPHIHAWDNGTITTEPTETESGIKTYSCSGCSETKTEIVYAQSQSSWDSAFEKAEAATNVTVNISTIFEGGDETEKAHEVYLLENHKFYMFIRTPEMDGGYHTEEQYYAKIDGINYEFREQYLNDAWVWVKIGRSYDDIPYTLGSLILPSTLILPSAFLTELKNSYDEFEYDINTNTYSGASITLDLDGMTFSDITIVIEDGTLISINYTIANEHGRGRQEIVISDYGTTVVDLPEAVLACTHSFTVFDPSTLCLCCEFCDEYLSVSDTKVEYVGSPIRFVGDVVSKEDISVTLCYSGGVEISYTEFTLENTTLSSRETLVKIVFGDRYSQYIQVSAYPVGSAVTDDGFVYVEENGAISIVGYRGTNTNVIVPESIDSKPVTVIDEDAFYFSNIENIVLPESLVRIGSYAFANTKLTTIIIPKNVTIIGGLAFLSCNELTSVIFEDTIGWHSYRYIDVTNADRNVLFLTDRCSRYYWYKYSYEAPKEFENTDGFLYTVENGEATIVDYIGNLDNFTVPSEIENMPVVAIGQGAFASLNATNIELAEGIKTIHGHAFDYCSNLTNLVIPKSVTSIGNQAFMDSGIIDIYIHENITNLDAHAFDGCSHLTSITVSENNQYYKSIDGNLYTKDGRVLIQYALGKSESSFVIPDCVEEIGETAFRYTDNLISITIPTRVKKINGDAFYHYDTKLVSIIFENTKSWLVKGEEVNVSDSEQNVIYLTDTYSGYMWCITSDANPDDDNSGDSGIIGDDDSENDDSNEDIEQEIKESPVSYSEFQAEWYAKKFSDFDFSYANDFLTGIESDPAIMLAINTWTGIHIVADPSYAIGELSKEDLYVIVIYDLLTGNSGEFENPMDLFKNDSLDYMYEAIKILFGTSDVEMDWELLKKIDPTAHEHAMLNSNLFDNLDIVGHVFDTFDNLYDALEACARYQAISNMSEGFKNVLQAVYNDTSNETALRNAALKCIEYFENACNTTMQDILAQEYIEESAEYVLKVFVSESWGFLLKNVFPEAMVVQFAFKGVAILGDTLFKLDATTEAFYQLKVVVGFENAIKKILESNEFDYSNAEKCSNYLYAVETFQRTVLLGLDYSAALLQSRVGSFGISDTLKQKHLSQIETIEEIKADRLETYLLFENISQRMYQAYCNLDNKGAETPVTALMLSLGVGSFSFEGNYYVLFDNICGSMEEAKAFCENIGGHLAIIDSQEENDAVYSGLVSLGYRNAFFGLTDSQKEGTWLTVTGNSPTYTNWHSGEPNSESSGEDWAMFYWKYTNGQWNDGNFTGTVSGGRAFICEWN